MSMIERLLNEEIRDKKRTGNGIHSKTGSRGYVGKMMFPTDLMNSKQKRNYQRSGEVVSWNMKEVLPKLEFEAYEDEQKKEMLIAWRANYPNRQIWERMGLTQGKFYALLEKLDVPRDAYKVKNANKTRVSKAIAINTPKLELVEKREVPTREPFTPTIYEGLNFNINGTYSAEDLNNWLTKLQVLTEGMGDIDVVIQIREKK